MTSDRATTSPERPAPVVTDGTQVWIFDKDDPDRLRPKRGVVHEVHQPGSESKLTRQTVRTLCVSGAMQLRHDDMVRSGACFKPFLLMPVVETFAVADPTKAAWPHLGKFAALSFTEGTTK